ncbi:hypothetical protein AB1O90_02820 [Pediococcus pentosaceus]|jgi:hypothetical protein|uniref:hypothetical protein n=1 Tax=Pediococcus pentosaceus TaxID=1255 RepID=UPI003462DB69
MEEEFKSTNRKIATNMYLYTLFIYFVYSFLNTTMFTSYLSSNINRALKYMVVVCVFVVVMKVIIFDRFKYKELLMLLPLTILMIYIAYKSGDFLPATVFTFIVGAKEVEFRRILNIYIYSAIILSLITIFSSKIGLIENLTYFRGNTLREAWGFVYPTNFSAHIFYIIAAIALKKENKVTYIEIILFFVISIFVNHITDTRLDFIASIIVIFSISFIKLFKINEKKFILTNKNLLKLWAVLAPLGVTALTIEYSVNNHLLNIINSLLSNRLYFGNMAYSEYGVSIFGQKIIQQGFGGESGQLGAMNTLINFKYSYIDSSFFRAFMMYGCLFFVILVVTNYFVMKKIINSGNIIPVIIFSVTIACSMIDQHFLEIAYNPMLLVVCSCIDKEVNS